MEDGKPLKGKRFSLAKIKREHDERALRRNRINKSVVSQETSQPAVVRGRIEDRGAARARLSSIQNAKPKQEEAGLPTFASRKIHIEPFRRQDDAKRKDNAIHAASRTWYELVADALYQQVADVIIGWHFIMAIANFTIPSISRFSVFFSPLPVLLTILIGAILDGIVIARRMKQDKIHNHAKTHRLNASEAKHVALTWEEVRVGDILWLREMEVCPCDMIVLSTSHSKGSAHVDVADMMGRTSLQYKEACKDTMTARSVHSISSLQGHITLDHPDANTVLSRRLMQSFEGSLKLSNLPRPCSITYENLIYRGSVIRKVDWLYGICVFAGKDCYIHRLQPHQWRKKGRAAILSDTYVVAIICIVIVLVMMDLVNSNGINENWSYLDREADRVGSGDSAGRSAVLFCYSVPLLLPLTLRIIRQAIASSIQNARTMAVEHENCVRKPEIANVDVIDSLGSVDIVFLEKTGTVITGDVQMMGYTLGDSKFGVTKSITEITEPISPRGPASPKRAQTSAVPSSPEKSGDESASHRATVDASEEARVGDSQGCSPLRKEASFKRSPPMLESAVEDEAQEKAAGDIPQAVTVFHSSSSSSSTPSSDSTSSSHESSSPKGSLTSESRQASHMIKSTSLQPKMFEPVELPTPPSPNIGDIPALHSGEQRVSGSKLGAIKPVVGNESGLYTPDLLMLPRTVRDDLHAEVAKPAEDFDREASGFFKLFYGSEQRSKLTQHFCRSLAVCNHTLPYLVATKVPSDRLLDQTASPSDRRSSRSHTMSVSHSHVHPPCNQPDSKMARKHDVLDIDHPYHTDILGMLERRPEYKYDESCMKHPYVSFLQLRTSTHVPDPRTGRYRKLKPWVSDTYFQAMMRWDGTYTPALRYENTDGDQATAVSLAAKMGFVLVAKFKNRVDLDVNHQFRRFQIYASSNKRDQIVVVAGRGEEDRAAIIYAAGPLTVTLPHLDLNPRAARSLRRQIRRLSRAGYKSTIYAYRTLNETEADGAAKLYGDGEFMTTALRDRLDRQLGRMVRKLRFLGLLVTRHEVREDVTAGLRLLRAAGCGVWILSGDDAESCLHATVNVRLLNQHGKVFNVGETWRRIHFETQSEQQTAGFVKCAPGGQLRRELLALLAEFKAIRKATPRDFLCIVFNGKVISTLLSDLEMQSVFMLMACASDVVICSKLTLFQKHVISSTIRNCLTPTPVIMAVSQGTESHAVNASADIGVNYRPHEKTGKCPSYTEDTRISVHIASDITIPSFESLTMIMATHGADALVRCKRIVMWALYTSTVIVWPNVWFRLTSGEHLLPLLPYDWAAVVLVTLWPLMPPFSTLLLPPLNGIPDFSTAVFTYRMSRQRIAEGAFNIVVLLLEAIICSVCFYLAARCVTPAQVPLDPMGLGVMFCTGVLVDVHIKWTLFEWAKPMASWRATLLCTTAASLPALIGGVLVMTLTSEYRRGIFGPVMLYIGAAVLAAYTIHQIALCRIFAKQRGHVILSDLLKKLRQPVGHTPANVDAMLRSDVKDATLASSHPDADVSFPLLREKPTFSLVSRLRPYATILLRAACWSDQNSFGNLPSRSSDLESRPDESLTPKEVVPDDKRTEVDDEHDYMMEQMTADAFVEDDVSLASMSVDLASDLFDLDSDEGEDELQEADEDFEESLSGDELFDLEIADHTFPLGTKVESLKNVKFARKDEPEEQKVEAGDLIKTSDLTFQDHRLESHFQISSKREREQFRSTYFAFFVGTFLAAFVAARAHHNPAKKWLSNMIELRLLRMVVAAVYAGLSCTRLFYRHFELFVYIFNAFMIIVLFPYRLTRYPPVEQTSIFAVWCFVISRTSILEGTMFCALYMFSVFVGLFLSAKERLGVAYFIYALTIDLGICTFVGFVGNRLQFSVRRRFLLNYQVEVSRDKQREILGTMLPEFVVDQILTSEVNEDGIPTALQAEDPGTVTVIFIDVYEFHTLVSTLDPTRLVELLDTLFLYLDQKCQLPQFSTIVKIETVFETYLCCAGIKPGTGIRSSDYAADAIVALKYCVSCLEDLHQVTYDLHHTKPADPFGPDEASKDYVTSHGIRVKIGMHTGTVTSGVVGAKKPQYALFGDTVNTASRMKLTGKGDHVHISDSTYICVKNEIIYEWEEQVLEVKGKGLMKTYLLTGVYGKDYPFQSEIPKRDYKASLSLPSEEDEAKPPQPGGSANPLRKDSIHLTTPPSSWAARGAAPVELTTFRKLRSLIAKFDTARFPLGVPWPGSPPNMSDESLGSQILSRRQTVEGVTEAPLLGVRFLRDPAHGSAPTSRPSWPQRLVHGVGNVGSGAPRVSEHSDPATLGDNRESDAVADDVTIDKAQLAQKVSLKQFSADIHYWSLKFRKSAVEDEYAAYLRSDNQYLTNTQASLIIFMLTQGVSTVARVYSGHGGPVVRAVMRQPTNLVRPVLTTYWGIRFSQLAVGLLIWMLFHGARDSTSEWYNARKLAVKLASTLYIVAAISFVLTPSWDDSSSEDAEPGASWTWNADMRELGASLVFLHHNNGLHFHQLIATDVLVVTLVEAFVYLVATPSKDVRITVWMFPVMFLFQLLSAYVKELYDRMTWYVTRYFQSSEDRSRLMLADMLPKEVLEEFSGDRLQLAYHHRRITFLFADIVGFTSYAKTVEATDVVRLLQKLFARFDRDSTRFNLYKLCTIGDAYVAVSDPPTEDQEHYDPAPGAEKVWEMSQAMLTNISKVAEEVGVPQLNMRIGLHFGECVGGVIGSGRLRYDFWGNDVLVGNQMESSGAPGRVNVSQALKDFMDGSFPKRFEYQFNKIVPVLNIAVHSYFMSEIVQTLGDPSSSIVRITGQSNRRLAKRRTSMMGISRADKASNTSRELRNAVQTSTSRPINKQTIRGVDNLTLDKLREQYQDGLKESKEKSSDKQQ